MVSCRCITYGADCFVGIFLTNAKISDKNFEELLQNLYTKEQGSSDDMPNFQFDYFFDKMEEKEENTD